MNSFRRLFQRPTGDPVALCTIYGQSVPQGKLPVNVPNNETAEDGTVTFLKDVLYSRGFGLENWNE